MELINKALRLIQDCILEASQISIPNARLEINNAAETKSKEEDKPRHQNNTVNITIYTDASVRQESGGCGCVIHLPNKEPLKCNKPLSKDLDTQSAEYEGILLAVEKLARINIRQAEVSFFTDNKVIAAHLSQRSKAKRKYTKYLREIQVILKSLQITASFCYIHRSKNSEAHKLARLATNNNLIEETI